MNRYFIKTCVAVIVVTIIATYIYWGNKDTKEKARQHFIHFNNSKIAGRIKKIDHAFKGIELTVDSSYIFYPLANEANNFAVFGVFANAGDSVYKPAHADTLRLVKRDSVYLFTFKKHINDSHN